ncbi:5-carboxymethyl-2-hydroxymuconate isomerase [Herbaspirillum sp. Sphag1AN]|uniref:5-carboxymethyl-2-hydroxymuconate Delta-isomerase n=1 Tax=unclassified Herbaspirillum TaxID=2624150 RepID=UPI00160748E6|nr:MULTISPECIES: 5-carboxymethyl-2-hydroxymuconate Delta-isomerase [unclassified Herbaspirillum]MBB3211773.1 5-carboxymethyl-2-hydroxymuconate isomerase [Herbaspirillum sp. Sphag1AN]MBB3244393.1 5-carboxymethyl-2-hydroxymuconate isomerase [Herbaspirillum sp. Sphag64]
MPHLTLEYSANLGKSGALGAAHPELDFNQLCQSLAHCLIEQQEDGKQIYPTGGVRVRALAAKHYCIANSIDDGGFVHGTLKIGAGRSEAVKKATGDALFAVLKQHFAALYLQSGLALSLEIIEVNEAGSWKHNNLHARFR